MAEVFEAELAGELGFVRKVAIKRMLGEAAADPEMARRFLDEARIASRLHHGNIVSVLDVGLLDDLPFQVLELIEGIDAQQLQTRVGGTLPLDIALILTNEVAHALDHAHGATDANGHSLGIVHRDVKPSNVLVGWGGDVKLTDFGIAFAHERATQTEAGLVPGTRGFIAPEQRTRAEIDGRTDVFSLGLTLHALLTGYTPLRDISAEIELLDGKPIELDPTLPADVRDLIARATMPDRRDRFTAAQLADAVSAVLASHLRRDPRSRLREFLEPLNASKPKPGALDRLLGIDVVLAEPSTAADVARYELRSTVPATPGLLREQRPEPPPAAPPAPPRRHPWLVGAGIFVVAIGAGVAGQRVWSRDPVSQRSDAVVEAAMVDASVTAPRVTSDAAVVEVATVMPTQIDAGVARTSPHRPGTRRDAGADVPAITPTKHEAAPPAEAGYLQVIGEQNIGAKILIDGAHVGYAPNKLEVPRGTHTLKVLRKDGTEQVVSITVTEYHTVQRPLKPTL